MLHEFGVEQGRETERKQGGAGRAGRYRRLKRRRLLVQVGYEYVR